ncbi:hypothetical protein FF38_12048 [Lucilia cuprina]|uniref:Uncharacterized protein n=1 Tax=Lucilia cuprina TaxID=7375 RepID=A0A0L0BPM4_LUCCU|nr:hypothetical protein FF38_12048 [Lucilia cuprina]
MEFFKFICIIAIVMAVSAKANYNYDTKYIKDINDVVLVQKSSTCVILVVDDKIKFVSTEGNAPKELAKCRNSIKGKNMEIVKATFEPLSTTDVVEKLAKIGKKRDTFLVYFNAVSKSSLKGSVTVATKRPVGLLGNLLSSLGVDVQEKGLVPIVLSLLGIGTSVTDVKTIEFQQ